MNMLVISGFKPEVDWKSGHLRTCKYISKTGRNEGFLIGWIRQTKLATGVKPASSVASQRWDVWNELSKYTVSQKICYYIFYNNFNSKCPITIIFGTVCSKSMCHQKMVSFPTSPI